MNSTKNIEILDTKEGIKLRRANTEAEDNKQFNVEVRTAINIIQTAPKGSMLNHMADWSDYGEDCDTDKNPDHPDANPPEPW